jgi:hypothetical protein
MVDAGNPAESLARRQCAPITVLFTSIENRCKATLFLHLRTVGNPYGACASRMWLLCDQGWRGFEVLAGGTGPARFLSAADCCAARTVPLEVIRRIVVDDLLEHRNWVGEVGLGSRDIACAMQLGRIRVGLGAPGLLRNF